MRPFWRPPVELENRVICSVDEFLRVETVADPRDVYFQNRQVRV